MQSKLTSWKKKRGRGKVCSTYRQNPVNTGHRTKDELNCICPNYTDNFSHISLYLAWENTVRMSKNYL